MRPDFLASAIPLLLLTWSAAVWDLNQRRIPNPLIVVGVLAGCGVQLFLMGASGLPNALAGLAVGGGIFLPGYLMGTTGAGDVKLMAAAGTLLGPYNMLLASLATIAVGGVIALGFMVVAFFSPDSRTPWQRYGLMLKNLLTTGRAIYIAPASGEVMGRKFPFAVSIAIGTTLFLLWQSPLMAQTT